MMTGRNCHCPNGSSSSSSSSEVISTVGTSCGACNPIPRRWRITVPTAGGSTHTCHSLIAGKEFVLHFHTNFISVCQYGSDFHYDIGGCGSPSGSGPCVLTSTSVTQSNAFAMFVTDTGVARQYLIDCYYRIPPSTRVRIAQWRLQEAYSEDCFGDKVLPELTSGGCQHSWAGGDLTMTVEP